MIGSFIISVSVNSVYAAPAVYSDAENESKYTFTEVIDEEGNSSYKIAIRSALRTSLKVAIIPETYNNAPVTEIANNGFYMCTKLEKVYIPKSVIKIGKNAFYKCKALDIVLMPHNINSIGEKAFSDCSSLDRLFIPNSVNNVGASAFNNVEAKLYIQKSREQVSSEWESTWSNSCYGEIVYDSEIEDTIKFTEVKQNEEVIGVSVNEQILTGQDVVIYNSIKLDNGLYLPVLNIGAGAFAYNELNSLTFRDRREIDKDAPEYNHSINILSNAFEGSEIEEINFEVGITFIHPNEKSYNAIFDEDIISDGNNNSQRIFRMSIVRSVTLPQNLRQIPKEMFADCFLLEEIKIFGQGYDGNNVLPAVAKIGDGAFSSCTMLSNLFIPETVTELGNDVFYDWGYTLDQTIHIAQYKDEIAGIWGENWNQGIQNNCTVQYKPLSEVTLHYMDDENRVELLKLKVDRPMPELEIPEYVGHIFKGIYTEKDGNGIQFYTSNMEGVRDWDDSTENLYVNWNEVTCTLTLDDGTNKRQVDAIYGATVPAVAKPTLEGHEFKGYYLLDENGERKYYYDENMNGKKWDRTENATLKPDWKTIDYAITYVNITEEEKAQLPQSYTVYDGEVIIPQLQRKGYTFSWDIDRIPEHYLQDITITANWSIIQYDITYRVYIEGVEVKDIQNPNPEKFTVEDEIWLIKLEMVGHDFKWDIDYIPKGTDHDVYIYGTFTPSEYDIRYEVDLKGLTNPNQNKYRYGELVEFVPLEKTGYTFEWIPNKIEIGNAEDKIITGVWTPIKYEITYIVWSGTSHSNPKNYTINDVKNKSLQLYAPVYSGYICTWDKTEIPQGSTEPITITAIYTEKTLSQCINSKGEYEIYTLNQLKQIAKEPNGGLGRSYYLMRNIIWEGDGMLMSEFRGRLYGQGYSITGLKLTASQSNVNVGFVGINYGIIERITFGADVMIGYDSNVNVGVVCGINESGAVIKHCDILAGDDQAFVFYAKGDSYGGAIAGINNGEIDFCINNLEMYTSSNLGGIAGYNSTNIIQSTNHANINIHYMDYNCCVGGIAGKTKGSIIACYIDGYLIFNEYASYKYDKIEEDRDLQMCVGIVAGYCLGGGQLDCRYSGTNGNVKSDYNFTVVKWGIFNSKKNDQGLYFRNDICGRED